MVQLRRVAVGLLYAVEKLHSLGYIHRDLKPQNVMFDREERVELIDFGVSARFHDEHKTHVKFEKQCQSVVGTPTFMSQNAVKCISVSRRDDLESMLYVLVHMHKNHLPWQNYSEVKQECTYPEDAPLEFREARAKLSDKTIELFFPRELRSAFRYVRALSFTQKPDYAFLRDLIANRIKQNKSDLLELPAQHLEHVKSTSCRQKSAPG